MVSLNEKAYALIKEKIIFCRFAHGEVINEKTLIEDLAMGRTPIREAILRLASENLLSIIPRKGVVVTNIDLLEVSKLLEMRSVIEVHYAREIIDYVNPSEINKLRKLLQDRDEAKREGNIQGLVEADRAFHIESFRLLGNTLLVEILNKIYDRLFRIWVLVNLKRLDYHPEIDQDHYRILAALEKREKEALTSAISDHIDHVKEKIFSVIMK